MRIAFLATGWMLVAMLPVPGAEVKQPDEDPWVGKTRTEVVQLLGKPQKAKRSGGGEKLTYKFLRLDLSASRRLDVQLLSVPGIGIVAKPSKAGLEGRAELSIGGMEFDEHGRAIGDGTTVSQTASSSDAEASTGLGKVKLHLILDPQGLVTEWSVSGKK